MAVSIFPLNSAAALEAAAASAAGDAAPPLAGLQPGVVIAARVLALLENGQVQLAIGDALVEATTEVPLPIGATVQLAVQNTRNGTTLQLVDQAASQTVASDSSAPRAVTSGAVMSATAVAEGSQGTNTALLVGNAFAGSRAPAATDVDGAASAASATTVMAPTVSANAAVTPSSPAVASPDLPVTVAPPLAPPVASPPTVDAAIALQTAVRAAAATQNSLSPLFAEIAAAVDLPALPEPVQREALRLLSLRPPLDGNLAGEDVKQAFTNSGLFLEARIAENVQPSTPQSASVGAGSAASAATTATMPAAASPLPATDLKAVLIVFRQVLAMALAEGDTGTPSAPLAIAEAVPAPAEQFAQISEQVSVQIPDQAPDRAPDRTAMPAPSATRFVPSGPATSAMAAPALRSAQVSPPPPFRGGPVTAQPPVIATINATTPPHKAVQTLMAATEGALARQTLLQAASLPGSSPSHLDSGGPRWNFEVPFAVPQGDHIATNVAQFEISRDGKAATPADGSGPVWRARFSVDIDPIGRVHAQIGLRGVRTAVMLWAENPEGAARLRAGAATLTDALRAAELDAGDLVVRDGAPRTRAVAAGYFLDRAS